MGKKITWTWQCNSDKGHGLDREICNNRAFGFNTKQGAIDDYNNNCMCRCSHGVADVQFVERPIKKQVKFTFTRNSNRKVRIRRMENPHHQNHFSLYFDNGDYEVKKEVVETADWGKRWTTKVKRKQIRKGKSKAK